MKTIRLILFRHADKKNDLHSDPELNPAGHKKAQTLSETVLSGALPSPTTMWASPKKRAVQTFEPLAKSQKLNLHESKFLLESQAHESRAQLQTRIEVFMEKMSGEKEGLHYVCSHYDWVIEFCELFLGPQFSHHTFCHHWRPCQYIEFEMELTDSHPHWKAQILSHGVIE